MIRSASGGGLRRAAAASVAAVVSAGLLATTGTAVATDDRPSVGRQGDGRDDVRSNQADGGPDRVARPARGRLKLRLLALNDFHGQLAEVPSTSSSGRINETPAGGAEYLATHLRKLRREARREDRTTLTVAAGDLVGASPLLSAAFHDEPTIEAMNAMGLDVSSVGNHEFDEGWRELVRLQRGGCLKDGAGKDNQDSCPGGKSFAGADFDYLAANVVNTRTGRTILPGVSIKRIKGVPVAFIGMTLEDTPNIVTKAGVEGLDFTDEAKTANRYARQLNRQGVKSIVVLVHEGGFPEDSSLYNECPGVSGPIVEIQEKLSSRIDAVVTGHTHRAYNCVFEDPAGKPRLVTSASSVGRIVTKIDLTIGKRTGEVVRKRVAAENLIVTRDVRKNAALTKLIERYQALVAPIESKVIGALASGTSMVSRDADDSDESPLGNLIADAQRADTTTIPSGGSAPVVAFMNPGGIRADLAAEPDGDVTYGAAFTTQPFNNYLVSMDLTGLQILDLLEEQWSGTNAESPKVLQVSGMTYSWTESGGTRSVVPGSVQVGGEPLVPTRTYRVVANSFLADGGDGFGTFAAATGKYFGGLDIDALAEYLSANSPYTPVATDRITQQ